MDEISQGKNRQLAEKVKAEQLANQKVAKALWFQRNPKTQDAPGYTYALSGKKKEPFRYKPALKSIRAAPAVSKRTAEPTDTTGSELTKRAWSKQVYWEATGDCDWKVPPEEDARNNGIARYALCKNTFSAFSYKLSFTNTGWFLFRFWDATDDYYDCYTFFNGVTALTITLMLLLLDGSLMT
ncbi:hypothetical protein H072_1129 [Dactylellina haptotyla CBS 200.50]|uniref:Uncharacterized protein n=1 Tax=Dactylellina haptotyla (strain CBS 200.50) TaxID=1284197 RepID=S8BZM1_DACHA|nr:hypothetical protein H072_1129 [Dactylellina haptotyla CBS 200.50]